jgi:hypothetical protein
MQRRVSLSEEGVGALAATRCTQALLALVSISEHRTYICDALRCSCTTLLFPGPGAARRLPCGDGSLRRAFRCIYTAGDCVISHLSLLVPPIRPAI